MRHIQDTKKDITIVSNVENLEPRAAENEQLRTDADLDQPTSQVLAHA